MEMHIEMKALPTSDPFNKELEPIEPEKRLFENDTVESRSVLGQLTLYAASQLARQHRLWIFSLAIFGNFARLFRWDRAGVVISDRFDYTSLDFLSQYFWRFARLTPIQRGHDPTVSSPSAEEERLFHTAIKKCLQGRKTASNTRPHPKMSIALHKDFPRWKLLVDDRDGKRSEFIVGKPIFCGMAATGRCTRGYIALELEEKRLMFLKDTWRPDHLDIQSERETYKTLEEKKVPNIAVFWCGDDVINPDGDIKPAFDALPSVPPGTEHTPCHVEPALAEEDSQSSGDNHSDADYIPPSCNSKSGSTKMYPTRQRSNISSSQTDDDIEPSSSKVLTVPQTTRTRTMTPCDARPGAQVTSTPAYSKTNKVFWTRAIPYIHYRMVQDSICIPLTEFDNSRHLVQVIYDALLGKLSYLQVVCI